MLEISSHDLGGPDVPPVGRTPSTAAGEIQSEGRSSDGRGRRRPWLTNRTNAPSSATEALGIVRRPLPWVGVANFIQSTNSHPHDTPRNHIHQLLGHTLAPSYAVHENIALRAFRKGQLLIWSPQEAGP